MPFEINPSEIYVTGVPAIDEQHQKFVTLISNIYDSPIGVSEGPAGHGLLDELLAYAAYHFKAEETLMATSNYAGLCVHAEEHAAIAGELSQHVEDLKAGRIARAKFVMFLWKWLVNHTHLADKTMGEHLRANGVA